jgi:[calcium/calmodulin-dependent protein kinase] kinase
MASDDTLNPKTPFEEEVHDDGYTADDNVLNSDDEAEYDSSSDSDGGLVMSRRKSASKSTAEAVVDAKGRRLSTRSKKSRSGSSNTMKKVRTRESEDERRRSLAADIAES